jgi:hypothetical protein
LLLIETRYILDTYFVDDFITNIFDTTVMSYMMGCFPEMFRQGRRRARVKTEYFIFYNIEYTILYYILYVKIRLNLDLNYIYNIYAGNILFNWKTSDPPKQPVLFAAV